MTVGLIEPDDFKLHEVDLTRNEVRLLAKEAVFWLGWDKYALESPEIVDEVRVIIAVYYVRNRAHDADMTPERVNPHDVRAVWDEMNRQFIRVQRYLGL